MIDTNDTLVNNIVTETGYPKCVVSVVVGLSYPLRVSFITFCNTVKALLLSEKSKLVGKSKSADIIAQQLDSVIQAGRAALSPYDTVLNSLPIQQMIENCPTFGEQFTKLFGNIPVEIPTTPTTQLLGLDGFDVFAGVKNYHSLRTKLDELSFRMERALTVSDRVNTLSHDLDDNINALDIYLDILSRTQ